MLGANHNIWLNKLRWKTANNEFKKMRELRLDCFRYVFINNGLTQEQQSLLMEFM